MLEWFKKWFKRMPHEWTAEDIEHEDPNARAMIARVMNSGKPMVGSYDENGNFTSHIVGEPEVQE